MIGYGVLAELVLARRVLIHGFSVHPEADIVDIFFQHLFLFLLICEVAAQYSSTNVSLVFLPLSLTDRVFGVLTGSSRDAIVAIRALVICRLLCVV